MFTALYVKTTLALENFNKDQRGVTAIEYAIIGVAISGIVLAVFGHDKTSGLGLALDNAVGEIGKNLGKLKASS